VYCVLTRSASYTLPLHHDFRAQFISNASKAWPEATEICTNGVVPGVSFGYSAFIIAELRMFLPLISKYRTRRIWGIIVYVSATYLYYVNSLYYISVLYILVRKGHE
jgi:hypothetical protein